MLKKMLILAAAFFCLAGCASRAFGAQAILLAPAKPGEPDKSRKTMEAAHEPESGLEANILAALIDFAGGVEGLDIPQSISAVCFPERMEAGAAPERRDLLGDLEEIRYHGHKAWTINMGVQNSSLCQFLLTSKPLWDEKGQKFRLESVKTIVPVHDLNPGWSKASGEAFEIAPLTIPFGLMAPCLFSARVILDGKPAADVEVRMIRLSKGKDGSQVGLLEARSDANGQFAFVLNQSGWWRCEAVTDSEPLRGPDGALKPAERIASLWIHVDAPGK